MKTKLLPLLVCPNCKGPLQISGPIYVNDEIESGKLVSGCGQEYIIKDFIPRFVPADNYAKSFGFEWNKHRTTQLDSANKNQESEKRFLQSIDFPISELKGKLVLDAGCGMGRFTEVVLKYGGIVVGIDLSSAVDAAFKNMGLDNDVNFIQADIFNLPFKKGTFDFIYSLGVLHHTPDPKSAFVSLSRLLKSNGKISITLYSAYQKIFVYNSKFWRFFTTRMPKKMLYFFCYLTLPLYYLYTIPLLGNLFKAIFVINIHPDWRWRLLDTFDWYSPKYQFWYTHFEVFKWFSECRLAEVKVLEPGISFIGCRKPE